MQIPLRSPLLKNSVSRYVLLAAVLIGLILRFLCIGIFEYGIYSDSEEFRTIALNLITSKGFSLGGLPTAYRMPGYPLFLAVIYKLFHTTLAVKIIQVFLEIGTGVIIYIFTRTNIGRREAVIAFCIWMLLPVSILQPITIMSEGLFTLLLMSQIFVMTRRVSWKTTLLSALLCGLSILIKPFLLLFPVVFALNLFLHKISLKKIIVHTGLYSAIVICCLLPWIIRNQQVLAAPVISTNGGQNLYIGNSAEATGSYFKIASEKYPVSVDEVVINRYFSQHAKLFIFSHPVAVLKTIPKKLAYLFSLESPTAIFLYGKGTIPNGLSYKMAYRSTPVWMLLTVNLPYILLLSCAVFSFFLFFGTMRSFKVLLLVLCFWGGIHCIYFGTARFHYPLLPLFTIAASVLPLRLNCFLNNKKMVFAAVVTCGLFFGLWALEIAMVYLS